MKILYDLIASQPTKTSKFHGGSEYCKSIFYKILENNYKNIEVVINPDRDIDEKLISICKEKQIKVNKCTNIEELSNLVNSGYNRFYSALPYEYNKLKINKDVEFIYTIHGLRQLELPTDKYASKFENVNIRYIIARLIRKFNSNILDNRRKNIFQELFDITTNRKILVPSYHTKYSLMNFFPKLNHDDIKVLYAPQKKVGKINYDNEKDILKKYDINEKKYILMVSGDRWLKNNYRAIKALDNLFSRKYKCLENIKVIVLGVVKDEIYSKNIKNKEKFIFEGYKQENELEILYKNAHLFLYPTLNEGFGYPPLEAMKYNTYVAVSTMSSIPEVCGDSVLYFNPYDLNEIGNRVLQSFDDNIMDSKKNKMKNQYKYISNKQKQDLDKIVEEILI